MTEDTAPGVTAVQLTLKENLMKRKITFLDEQSSTELSRPSGADRRGPAGDSELQ